MRMTRARRALSVLALTVLIAPVLLPGAVAQSPPDFSVLSVEREGDTVWFTITRRSPNWEVHVSLRDASGNDLVGLPDQRLEWLDDKPRTINFTLQKNVTTGVLHMWAREGSGWKHYSLGVSWPEAQAAQETSESAPRLLVMRAERVATGNVHVDVQNVGDASARDVVVSLEDAVERKIGKPYHRVIGHIPPGGTGTATFEVAEGVKEATVVVSLADGTERVPVTIAQPAASDGGTVTTGAPNVTLIVDLPFKETEIGRTVDYALSVRNTGTVGLVELAAPGLPDGYSARFFVGGNAVTRLFVDANVTRPVTLTVTVPNAESEVDRTVEFAVEARVNGTAQDAVAAGIAVRGVGRLEIVGGADLSQIPAGGSGTYQVTVRNTGSAPLFDVAVDARGPYGWSFSFEPRRLDRLDPGEETAVSVTVRAPDIVGPGRYVADFSAKSGDTSSRALTVGMEVPEPSAGSDWSAMIFLVLIASILGGAYWWKRRAT